MSISNCEVLVVLFMAVFGRKTLWGHITGTAEAGRRETAEICVAMSVVLACCRYKIG